MPGNAIIPTNARDATEPRLPGCSDPPANIRSEPEDCACSNTQADARYVPPSSLVFAVAIPEGAQGQGNQKRILVREKPDAKQRDVRHHHHYRGDVVLPHGSRCQSARSSGLDRYGSL